MLPTNAKKCGACDAAEAARTAQSADGDASGLTKPSPTKQPKITTRKQLTLMKDVPIGTFHVKHYLPALEKLAYHRPHCRILGKDHCGAERLAAFKRKPSIRTRRYYAERLAAAFNLEIQSEHFGNGRSLSMEGSSVETFCAAAVDAWQNGVWQMSEADLLMVFHSHLSDESRQDATTTTAHMKVLFKHLKRIGQLCEGMVDWDDTDGCAKQYRSALALYLLSVVATEFNITIDRAIGAPGHGKDLVDGLNAMDKIYLRHKMCMIGTPEANDAAARMRAHAMVLEHGGTTHKMSLAGEAKRLLSDPLRAHGVKCESDKKRQANAKMQERVYHVQDPAKVKYTNLSMAAVGFESGEHNGILAHYNLRADPALGVGWVVVRRIPCACIQCLEQLELPWKPGVARELQPRYAANSKCEKYPVMKLPDGSSLNDWRFLQLKPTKTSDAEEEEEAHAEVLAGITLLMAEKIEPGKYGAIATEGPEGFYILKFTSAPYTQQEDAELTEYTPAIRVKAGELLSTAEYYNTVPGARGWYTPTEGAEKKTIVRVQQVVAPDLTLAPISETNKLPSGMSKKNKGAAEKKKALKLAPEDDEMILEEISRREVLEHDEAEDSEDSDEEDSDDEDGEEDDEEGDGEGGEDSEGDEDE